MCVSLCEKRVILLCFFLFASNLETRLKYIYAFHLSRVLFVLLYPFEFCNFVRVSSLVQHHICNYIIFVFWFVFCLLVRVCECIVCVFCGFMIKILKKLYIHMGGVIVPIVGVLVCV